MEVFANYLVHYLIFVSFIAFVSLIGHFSLCSIYGTKTDISKKSFFFYALLTGISLIVIVFSLIITKFKTVNLVFLLLIIFIIIKNKAYYFKDFSINDFLKSAKGFIIKNYIIVLFLPLPFYLFEAVFLFRGGVFPYVIPFVDYIDMYNISQIITLTGQENNKYLLSNFYYPQFHGLSPYHFFELWVNGFLSFILPLPGTITLMLFVYPFFYFTSFIGLLALWEHYGQLTPLKFLLCFFLLFVGGMFFQFYEKYELLKWYGGVVGNITHIWGKKAAILYPFIILGCLSFIKQKYFRGIVAFLSLGIVSVGVLPGITGGLFLFILSNYFHKTLPKKDLKNSYIIVILFSIIFVSVYALMGNKNEEALGFTAIISELINAIDGTYLKTIFFRIVFPVLRLLTIFSPFLLFVFYVLYKDYKKQNNNILGRLLLLFIFTLGVGSIVGAVASINIFSGGQFFSYLFPLLIVFIITAFIHYYGTNALNRKTLLQPVNVIIILFFVFSTTYNFYNSIKLHKHYNTLSREMYGSAYLKKVTDFLNKHKKNPLGVCFLGKEDITSYPLNAYGVTGLTFSGFSVKMTKDFHAVSNITIFDLGLNVSDGFSAALFKSFEFYNFVQTQKNNNSFVSYEESQKDFIKYFDINFALAYKHAIVPESIKDMVIDEISDEISGQKFLIFK